jgi:hypothetical protein
MTTLLCRVKWYDSLLNVGCAAPLEAGYPDVFLTDAALRAERAYPKFKSGTSLVMVTYDGSLSMAAVPKALSVRLP